MALPAKIVPDVTLVSPSSKKLVEHGQRCQTSDNAWLLKGSFWRRKFLGCGQVLRAIATFWQWGAKFARCMLPSLLQPGVILRSFPLMPLSQFGPKSLGRAGGFGTMPNPSTTLPLMQLIQLLMPLLLKNGKTSCASWAEDILSATKGTEHHRPEPSWCTIAFPKLSCTLTASSWPVPKASLWCGMNLAFSSKCFSFNSTLSIYYYRARHP